MLDKALLNIGRSKYINYMRKGSQVRCYEWNTNVEDAVKVKVRMQYPMETVQCKEYDLTPE